MALIASTTSRGKSAEFQIVPTALTGADSLTYKPSVYQTLYLNNTGGSAVTLVIDGDGVGTVSLPGQGKPINNAAGYSVAIPAGQMYAIPLPSIRNFLAGVVNVTGGDATVKAWIVEG